MQNVTQDFKNKSVEIVRSPKTSVRIAWERIKDEDIVFAVVGTSTVDSMDIVQGELDIITKADLFAYDEENNVLSVAIDRELVEPMGGLSYARGTVILDNTDKRYTPNYHPVIGSYILPNRPMKVYLGFDGDLIPAIYGISENPQTDVVKRRTKISFYDYLEFIDGYELETTKFVDKRTDEILSDLLLAMGFVAEQFVLDTGLNTIGFAYYERGTKAGNAIRELVQAEEGFFYQDELGLLRFDNRRKYIEAPYTVTQAIITASQILDWQELSNENIINRVEVEAYPREVQDITEIWRSGGAVEVPAGATDFTIWANFTDPADSIEDLIEDTDYIANSASDGSGTDLTSNITITQTKFVTSCKLEIANIGATAYLTFLRLRGNSAIVVDEIVEIYEDTASQEIYGTNKLVVKNDKITSESFAYYLARALVEKYKSGLRKIRIKIPAMPHLQIRDKLSVQDFDTEEYIDMRIMRIQTVLELGGFYQMLELREISDLESDTIAIVGVTEVDNDDVIWL